MRIGGVNCELAGYVQHSVCADPSCVTVLIWNAPGGEDDGRAFWAPLECDCEYRPMVCREHRDAFVCPQCATEEEEPEPKRPAVE